MLLPARVAQPATSAETFEDLAGTGRRHVALGLAMAVACFSLTGLPLTVGLFGKIYLIRPAIEGHDYGLIVLMLINSAISAGYYLRIVGVMFLRPEPGQTPQVAPRSVPVLAAVAISVLLTLGLGIVWPAVNALNARTLRAASVETRPLQAASVVQP
jgi:NADH-quinone oxidoreductase subunit N